VARRCDLRLSGWSSRSKPGGQPLGRRQILPIEMPSLAAPAILSRPPL
jgi:hypothetical protein